MAPQNCEVEIVIDAPLASPKPADSSNSSKAPKAPKAPKVPKPPKAPKPCSPCFIGDALEPERPATDVRALLKCTNQLIGTYVALASKGVLCMSVPESATPDRTVDGHPIQDPTGGLTAALLVLRLNRPTFGCWMAPPYETHLVLPVRRALMAILTTCHKMSVAQTMLGYSQYVYVLLQHFLLPHEIPQWRLEWEQEFARFDDAEAAALFTQPLLTVVSRNPMTAAGDEIGRLLDAKQIGMFEARVLRGSCFFLFGSSFLHPTEDVLEGLERHVGLGAIGSGAVSLLMTLYLLANTTPRNVTYQAPYDEAVEHVASVLLENALAEHSKPLRFGPYAAKALEGAPINPVQLMLAPINLALARSALREAPL
jgi:hypothetical protein